jgi:hypothetical protein
MEAVQQRESLPHMLCENSGNLSIIKPLWAIDSETKGTKMRGQFFDFSFLNWDKAKQFLCLSINNKLR